MKKVIYHGEALGLFKEGNFKSYMDQYEGASLNFISSLNYNTLKTREYSLPGKVKLSYENNLRLTPKGYGTVTLALSGDNLEDITDKILKAADDFSE